MHQYSRHLVALLVVAVVVAVAPAGVAAQPAESTNGSAFQVTLTDATGTEVTLDERPERVTTTNPSAAQVMWELDAESQVVGLTQFAHYLDGAERKANVSSTELGVSVERVVDTEPDLVLAPNATSVQTVERLRETGLTVYHFPEATDFEDVNSKTLTIGRLTGNEQAARETNAWVEANVEAVSTATADAEEPRLLYPLLGGFAVGDDTFITEIIETAGAENIAADEFDGYEVLNDERVIELGPDVLLVTDQTDGQILGSEPYASTPAGRTGSTVSLEVNYINQPAPRSLVYSTRNLTTQLHPGLYDESDYVSRSEAVATLDGPTSSTTGTDGLNTTDVDGPNSTGADDSNTPTDESPTGVSAPGFGPVVAVVSLVGGGLLARRRSGAA